MKLGQLSGEEAKGRLESAGIRLRVGPFSISVSSDQPDFWPAFYHLYRDFPLLKETDAVEFRIGLFYPPGLRRWVRRQVLFYLDDTRPFEPFTSSLALPFFEWGFNWCIYEHVFEFLVMHASVLSRDGKAIILPGPPGSGKSTLCAALAYSGWRLLSDEFALISLADCQIMPLPRPIGLKERSIHVISRFAPAAEFGPTFNDTRKGTVAHMRPPTSAVELADTPAMPAWLVFPTYSPTANNVIRPLDKSLAFARASDNCFNYRTLGAAGFQALTTMIDYCGCYEINFDDIDIVVRSVEDILVGSVNK
jgi:HprK-related kinase A